MAIINKLLDKLTDYIKVRGEKLKLDIIAQTSRLLAHLVSFLAIAVILFFIVIFLSLALSAYLNDALRSPHLGYLIVAGIYLIFFLGIIILLRSNKMQAWLETFFLNLSENISDNNEQ